MTSSILDQIEVIREKGNHLGTGLSQSIVSQNHDWWPVAEDLTQRRVDILNATTSLEDALIAGDLALARNALSKIEDQAQYVGGRLLAYAGDLHVEPGAKNDMVVTSQAIVKAKESVFRMLFAK